MKIAKDPKDMDVLILCGGLGTRLRPLVPDRPKGLAEIDGKPFLEHLITYIAGAGFRSFILCIGHQGEQIREYFRKDRLPDLKISFSEESAPLGTAGALKNARGFIESNPFMAVNGDTFIEVDFRKLIAFHFSKNALLTMAVSKACESNDTGAVVLSDDEMVSSYKERGKAEESFVNMGIYIMGKEILDRIPGKKAYSLECDLFPKMAGKGFFGFDAKTQILDIGTPERYKRANNLLRDKG